MYGSVLFIVRYCAVYAELQEIKKTEMYVEGEQISMIYGRFDCTHF
jgi:hypothetical protein